jgi:hypothetical protein
MNTLILTLLILFSFKSFAVDTDQCDPSSPQERHVISTPDAANVEAVVCQQGDDVLVLTDAPIDRHHLLYAGLNLGMPWLVSGGLTYSQLKNGKQNFHISANLDGSLGGNGISAIYGKHPFGNSIFYGGIARGYKGLPGEGGFQMGPSIGISGGKSIITGHITLSYVAGYDSRNPTGLSATPEVSLGLRIRLFKN